MAWSRTRSRRSFSENRDLTDPVIVAANKQQEITPLQRRALRLSTIQGGSGGSAAIVVVFIVVIGLFFVPDFWAQLQGGDPLSQLFALAMLAAFAFLVISFSVSMVVRLRIGWLIRRDLGAGRVGQVEGQVVWAGRGYRPQASGYGAPRRLRFPSYGRGTLPPGRFRFYFLPLSGVILSAEPLIDDMDPAMPSPARWDEDRAIRHNLASVLAAVHGHGVGAFPLNRRGQLDPDQAAGLRRKALREIVVGAIFICMPWVWRYVRELDGVYFNLIFGTVSLSLILGFVSLLGLWSLFVAYRLLADAQAGRVEIVEGVVTTEMQNNGYTVRHHYCVEDRRYNVSRQAFNALIDGRRYRVYLAPRSDRLVGIEPI